MFGFTAVICSVQLQVYFTEVLCVMEVYRRFDTQCWLGFYLRSHEDACC